MIDILLVEDNIELANLTKALLLKKGFSLCHVATGEDALTWLKDNQARVLLLDIMLSGIDGFAVCQAVRQIGNMPILILSAKSQKSDQLLGFELGADDYIEKPVDLDILAFKIKALFSREIDKQNHQKIIVSSSIKIDLDAHQVSLSNQLLELNGKEFALLLLLIQNKGKTLHKNYIFREIWGENSFSEEQTLTVHIKMLRDKIEKDPRNPEKIKTVWGVGYRYEEI